MKPPITRTLKMAGMFLFLLGLLTGFIIMALKNPKMALAAHLEGVMNGIFLILAGLIWDELILSPKQKKIVLVTLFYGTFGNWLFTLLAAILGTSKATPIKGFGFNGTIIMENMMTAGFVSIGVTMTISLVLLVYGLRGNIKGNTHSF